MAIQRNPRSRASRSRTQAADEAAARFITDDGTDQPKANGNSSAQTGQAGKKVVVMKMPAQMVARIDAVAARKGISRTAWCTDRLATALEAEE